MKLEVEVVAVHTLVDFTTDETKLWAVVTLGETVAEVPLTMEQYEAVLENYSGGGKTSAVAPPPPPPAPRELEGGDALGAEVQRVLRQGSGRPAASQQSRGASEVDASDGFNPEDDE